MATFPLLQISRHFFSPRKQKSSEPGRSLPMHAGKIILFMNIILHMHKIMHNMHKIMHNMHTHVKGNNYTAYILTRAVLWITRRKGEQTAGW